VRYRSLKTLTQPAAEPVSLSEAKQHCRVDTDSDDAYIGSLIAAAREWCEAYCDETFVHTRYKMTLDSFPTEIELPRPPMATAGTATAVVVTYTLENQTTARRDARRLADELQRLLALASARLQRGDGHVVGWPRR